jgi:transcriptional regulator with XRE-family HTH domain
MRKVGRPRATKTEHEIDIAVGRRIRAARSLQSMTQGDLGKLLGLSLAQVHKNETAQNRVSISRLVSIAAAAKLPLQFFLDDISLPQDSDPAATADAIEIAGRIARLPATLRKMVRTSVLQFEALSAGAEAAQ